MLDLLDILQGRATLTNPGTYYERLPETYTFPTSAEELDNIEVGCPIDYEIIDPSEWHYKSLLGVIMDGDSSTLTIKTRDQFCYKVGGFIATADAKLYVINSIVSDTRSVSREALRLFPTPFGTEYVLRLTEVENPRGLT